MKIDSITTHILELTNDELKIIYKALDYIQFNTTEFDTGLSAGDFDTLNDILNYIREVL